MRAFYSDTFVLPLPEGHRFPMSKYRLLRQRLVDEGVLGPGELEVAPRAQDEDLARVHTLEYLRAVAGGTVDARAWRKVGFPWSEELVERSRRSVGATLAAAEAAFEHGVGINLAGGTHHAYAERGEGYCVFNDVAVAARRLQHRERARRVLVVDLDVHQGNGSAAIFAGDDSVFTFSMHGARNYPLSKEHSDLDIALPDETGDEAYLEALEAALVSVCSRSRPDFVFYLAGADPLESDKLGRLQLSFEGLAARDERVFELCASRGLPLAIAMAGGYAPQVDDTVAVHFETVRRARRLSAGRSGPGVSR